MTLAVVAACSSDGRAEDSVSQTSAVDVITVVPTPTPPTTTGVQPTLTTDTPATTTAPIPSTAEPRATPAWSVATTTTAAPIATEPPHTGSAKACGDDAVLEDADGDGWGDCTAIPPLDPLTIIWWRRIGAYRQALCDAGYDAANEISLVPGGLDPATYEFFCATLTADQPPASGPDVSAVPDDSGASNGVRRTGP
jgi:hypothetical protein